MTIVRVAAPTRIARLRARATLERRLGAPAPLVGERIARLGAPAALAKGAVAIVAPDDVARNEIIGRGLARYKTALGMIVQHRDELGAVVGLVAQRLIRHDD